MRRSLTVVVLVWFVCCAASAETLVQNGGFEAAQAVKGAPSADQGFGVWKLGEGNLAPGNWTLNPALPGELSVLSTGAHSGKNCVRIRGSFPQRPAHLFQPCPGVKAGKWYVVRAWVRSGRAKIGFYEYFQTGPMRTPTVLTVSDATDRWQECSGYYLAPSEGFKSASLAIMVDPGQSADVDDVQVEEAPAMPAPADLPPIVLENDFVRMKLSPLGALDEFACKKTGVDYAVKGAPLFTATRRSGEAPVRLVERKGDRLEVAFADPSVKATLKLTTHRHYFTLAVERVTGDDVNWVQLCHLRLNITESVGTLINAAWNRDFAACVLACNDRTHSYGADGSRAVLCAKAYQEYGLEGAKVAILGAPQKQLLDVIEEVELAEGLPHPTINGVWIKRAPERFASYLMTSGVSEKNIDEVVEFAKGGFGCVEILNWNRSTPTYGIHTAFFPNGLAGLKKVADKIHAAGLQLGLHTMQGMVGWGPKDDPYIKPKADVRLRQERYAALAAAVDAKATDLAVKESVADWPDKGDLFLEGEIVRYGRKTPSGFAECQRGLWGTTVAAHSEGVAVGLLVNCFKMWGSTVYAPDVNSTMMDEICDNIARVFNEVGCDMTYFDGGEEIAVQPPHWRNQGRISLGVFQRLKKPVVLEGNAIYTHLAWHVISRGSPHYDPIYFGRREYTLRFKGQNPAGWAKNLLTGDVGWFAPHVWSPSTDAVTPDEVMLLCLKALGGQAPISFQVAADNLYANKRMPEMLEIIRACDELKRREYFSEEVCSELTKPMSEHVLERASDGDWAVRPLHVSPPRVLNAQRSERSALSFKSPHAAQPPWLRLRARTRLSSFGAKDNIIIADFMKSAMPFKPDGSASSELVHSAEPSSEKTPDGAASFCFRGHNKAKGPSGWCKLALPFDKPLNLTNHRRLGLWVRGESASGGTGGILNVQLANTYGYRDHYVPLDFTGWAYLELDLPEDTRFYDYRWPYNFVDLMYWVFRYHEVTGVNLYYNALPPGAQVACLISRIEALREHPSPLVSPALEAGGQKMTFPVSLKPEEYVEVDWTGKCRHFERDGGLIGEVRPQGQLRLAQGENTVRFTCEMSDAASARAEVTLATRGEPLANPRSEKRKADGERAKDDELRLLPGGKRGLRLVRGQYELVGADHPISAFDGAANVWTVTNDAKTASRAAVAILRGSGTFDVDYGSPDALTLETFDDLAAYEMSETNQFEKYVLGGGKQLTKDGPVRAGVSQTFVPSADGPRAGKSCGVYSARNDGGPGGWCGKGKRFTPPLDLSKHQAVAFWLHGDGKRETLRFQFRDTAGRFADWLVPLDFTGWRLQVFRTADKKDMDWQKVEYVIFYFNDIPAQTTVSLKLDDLKAFPKLRPPASLARPELTVNGQKIRLPMDVAAEESLTLDEKGRCALWRGEKEPARKRTVRDAAIVLHPGPNRLELSCDTSKGAPRDVTVRVVRIGPTEEQR